MLFEILIASFIVMLGAFGGAISFFKVIGGIIEKNIGFLISFTAGLFLFVSYELGKEAIFHSSSVESGLLWILIGAVFIWIIFKIIPHSHEHGTRDERKNSIDVRKILTGNGIHNVGDGILIAASFSINTSLGIITTISVFIHELVQETSIFFILRKAGYSIRRSLLINFAVSGTILIGSVGGYFLLSLFSSLEAPLLGISAGAFLIVVLQDLIPHSFYDLKKNRCFMLHILFFLLGIIIMFLMSLFMPHTHDHSEHVHIPKNDYHYYNNNHDHHD